MKKRKMKKPKSHVAQWKKDEVKKLADLIRKHKIVGIVDLMFLPSLQLQKMRVNLKGKALLKMSRLPLIKLAIEQVSKDYKGIEELSERAVGLCAIILSNENPFKLAKILNDPKSSAPAKAGQIAPNDIIVPAGPTSFAPGPIIGELGRVGIKSGVEDGKIAIKEDKLLVREGEEIDKDKASVLARLGIEPMEIGINLLGVYENGVVFDKKVLAIDEKGFMQNLRSAVVNAFALTLGLAYPTADNVKLLISRAFRESKAIVDEVGILTSENVGDELIKAERGGLSLKSKLGLPEVVPKVEEKEGSVSDKDKEEFEKQQKVAQDVLSKLQDEKIKEGRS